VAIEVKNIVKRFGAFAALDGVDLKVADGELLALLGPSGSTGRMPAKSRSTARTRWRMAPGSVMSVSCSSTTRCSVT
jgi:ABC-type uncharacterized transport system ATPase subunit